MKARRTALGVDAANNIYVISVPDREISLYEFMNELLKSGISFLHVLNLDGGPSTGIYAHWEINDIFQNSYSKVPSVIKFRKK